MESEKTLVVISDLHCGHRSGLTPKRWQYRGTDGTRGKYAEIQDAMWTWYEAMALKYSGVDCLIVNGDGIDGKGAKSGSTELITCDPEEQIEMFVECVNIMNPKTIIMTYGTPYHTGVESDYEGMAAKQLEADIHGHAFVNVGGVVFDVKHKVSSSMIPYGRHTAPARERVWNLIWNERDLQPKCDVFIRSHVHYFSYAGDARGLAITTPALQGPSTKFGARQCSGTVDVGLLVFKCWNGLFDWYPELLDFKFAKQEATVV